MSAAAFVLGLGLGGVALALVLARQSTKDAPAKDNATPTDSRGSITAAIWTPQTPQHVDDLLRTACGCVDAAPHLEDEDLVLCVWRAHWGSTEYPEASVAGDHPSVQQALDTVASAVRAAREGQCERLQPIMLADDALVEVEFADHESAVDQSVEETPSFTSATREQGPSLPNLSQTAAPSLPKIEVVTKLSPIDMAALSRAVPTPGYFYQVIVGERFLGDDGILARALYQAVLDAAKAKGWNTTKAKARAAALAADVKARVTYLSIVQCGPWNDAMYGTWGYGTEDLPAAHGRAIRLIARHDRVYERLAEGQTPIRTLDRGVPADKGKGTATGAGDMPELLWLPALRSDALLDANRSRQVVAEGLVWADGSSKYNPPPAVQELGIANAPVGPWGCKGIAA